MLFMAFVLFFHGFVSTSSSNDWFIYEILLKALTSGFIYAH